MEIGIGGEIGAAAAVGFGFVLPIPATLFISLYSETLSTVEKERMGGPSKVVISGIATS